MNPSIIPQKMEGGMIVAIQVKTEEKEEVFNIPPAPFETFEAMKAVISKYYEIDDIWIKAEQEYRVAKERFDLIDFRHKAALQDFKLLIAPKIEPKPDVILEPKKESVITKPEINQEPKTLTKIIVPPQTQEEPESSMHERAEKAGEELKNATVIIEPATTMGQEPPISPDSQMVKLMKEQPTLLTPEVKDLLPKKANKVLEDMSKRVEAGRAAADLSIPLEKQPKKPVSVEDWVNEVNKPITDRLENTEFNEERLEQELIKCGVPEQLVGIVKNKLIETWESDDKFEKKEEDNLFLKLKGLPQKIFGKKKKKPV